MPERRAVACAVITAACWAAACAVPWATRGPGATVDLWTVGSLAARGVLPVPVLGRVALLVPLAAALCVLALACFARRDTARARRGVALVAVGATVATTVGLGAFAFDRIGGGQLLMLTGAAVALLPSASAQSPTIRRGSESPQ